MTFYIETYGCQMNANDSALVWQILLQAGYSPAASLDAADIILLNTCSVREHAEQKVLQRLHNLFHSLRKSARTATAPPVVVGVLGCMAARLKEELFSAGSGVVTLVAGPDNYRDLPALIQSARAGAPALAADFDFTQNYNGLIGRHHGGPSSYVTIMRGCNNFCSYCIVPFVRGRERSRPVEEILAEIAERAAGGVTEICLLGQNVNSYSGGLEASPFKENTKNIPAGTSRGPFSELLAAVAVRFPGLWFRFLTSHPRDMNTDIIRTIATYENICEAIHLPVQSGSDRILAAMNRHYTAGHYMNLIEEIKAEMPGAVLSTDIIVGYPGESLADFQATVDLLTRVEYDNAYMFRYSSRAGTAASLLPDDVPEKEKIRRLNEIIELQNGISLKRNRQLIGRTLMAMVEKPSKRVAGDWLAKSQTGKQIVFDNSAAKHSAGGRVQILITGATSATLKGKLAD